MAWCASFIYRYWMMTFARNMAQYNSSLYGWDDGGDWEGEDQEGSALLFSMGFSQRGELMLS